MIKNDTLVDAVNVCLAGIGREPVPEVDTPDLDAAMALAIINQISQEVQLNGGRGWWFNQERGWKLQPETSTGIIYVPNSAVSILEVRPALHNKGNSLTIRGNKVYDTDQHTFDLRHISEDAIEFSLVMLLPYEDLPLSAKTAITWRARRIFVSDVLGDHQQAGREEMIEARAWQTLTSEHSRNSRRNALIDSPQTAFNLNMIGGLNNMMH